MPIGPLTLAAVADQMGVDVELIEFPARGDENDFVRQVAGAHVIGFSTVCSKYPRTILLAKHIKTLSPEILIVLGGPQASVTARETIRAFPFLDLVIRGEAEKGWTFFLDQIRRGSRNWQAVPGAVWAENNFVLEADTAPLCHDLDTLPMPKYQAYPGLANFPFAMIEAGRGCPYSCTFCCTNTFFSRQPRMKSPERIVAEMDRLHSLYGLVTFDFVHDMFTYCRNTVGRVCHLLKGRAYKWGCSSRTDTLNAETLDMMGGAGCGGFYFGVETGSSRMQKLLKKNLDVSEAVHVIDMVKKRGFRATVSVILGFPQETRNDVKDSLLLLTELMLRNVDTIQVPIWGPLADTPLTHSWKEFEFDGQLSNFADTDGVLSPAEEQLIRDNFKLFSSFYYPVGTEFGYSNYLVVTALLEELVHFPITRRYLLERDRIGFVNYLVRGGFDLKVLKLGRHGLAESLLRSYSQTSRTGTAVTRLLEFEKAVGRVARSPVGWREQAMLGAAEADSVLSRITAGHALGFNNHLCLWLIKEHDGVRLAFEN
jgi:radical SAM superfamily enzyme YgiQ (UPF0313 family)